MAHILGRIPLDDQHLRNAALPKLRPHGKRLSQIHINSPDMGHHCRIKILGNGRPLPAAGFKPQQIRNID